MAINSMGSWSEASGFQEMPKYHVRTRDSLVGEIADGMHDGQDTPLEERELLEAALKRMDQDGWKLVAAAGAALLFRALHRTA